MESNPRKVKHSDFNISGVRCVLDLFFEVLLRNKIHLTKWICLCVQRNRKTAFNWSDRRVLFIYTLLNFPLITASNHLCNRLAKQTLIVVWRYNALSHRLHSTPIWIHECDSQTSEKLSKVDLSKNILSWNKFIECAVHFANRPLSITIIISLRKDKRYSELLSSQYSNFFLS